MELIKNMPASKTLWNDFISMVFPSFCVACYDSIDKNEKYICTTCRHDMPITNYHLFQENGLSQRFWGRVNLLHAFAFLKYVKSGKVQQIIHSLKYDGIEEIGEMMGKWYGKELSESELGKKFDLILPVPLHKKRLKERGYNQSDSFARGLSETLNIEWADSAIERVEYSITQTRKKRIERWDNVKDIFAVKNQELIQGKDILLVDDVITTGATVEACVHKLLESGCKTVSIGAIATAY